MCYFFCREKYVFEFFISSNIRVKDLKIRYGVFFVFGVINFIFNKISDL